MIYNPTGGAMRSDPAGEGHFGASRDGRVHLGTDFICMPGQQVCSPIEGVLERMAYPYGDDLSWQGVVIRSDVLYCKMFYVAPYPAKIGMKVLQRENFGLAQDISEKYGIDMLPHVHLQVAFLPRKTLCARGSWNSGAVYVDPMELLWGP